LLQQLYTTNTTDKVVTKHRLGDRLNQKSIYSVEPLWQLISTHITDTRYNKIVQSDRDIYIITTCLQTQGVVVYTNNPTPRQSPSSAYAVKTTKDGEHMRLAILGSACQPVFMTPVKIDLNYATGKDKNFQYVDGGVREYAGIQMAIDQGASEVFCILLAPDESQVDDKQYDSLFPILERTISMFSEDVEKNDILIPQQYSKALRYIAAVKQKMQSQGVPQNKIAEYFAIEGPSNPFESKEDVRIFIIRPDAPLGGGPGGLVFNPAEMKGMISLGNSRAQDFVAKLDPKDVTWLV
jgi:predicted acylesterase/phospholipase RssA